MNILCAVLWLENRYPALGHTIMNTNYLCPCQDCHSLRMSRGREMLDTDSDNIGGHLHYHNGQKMVI